MNRVQELLDVTKQLSDHLDNGINEERDEYIATIGRLLDRRQALIDALPKTYTEEEKQLGKQIVMLNKNVDRHLKEQLLFLKSEIDKLQQNKRRQEQYSNPYKHAAVDGMYFDKKK